MRWPASPRLAASFYKAHGLGNDYVVFEEGRDWVARPEAVRAVCDPHRGVGADGIVALLADRSDDVFRLRMFNPDGSEFERSGNGLRVLGSYLVRHGERSPFTIEVGGSRVRMSVHGDLTKRDHDISVEMGRADVGPEAVALDPRVLDARGTLPGPHGTRLHVVPVSIGNPHLVVLADEPTDAMLHEIGPFLVAHPALAHGANVQIARATGRSAAEALIWERGVGPTSASGTSACAVAVALLTEGRTDPGEIRVHMPGGVMRVTVDRARNVVLRGPVEEVCTGTLTEAMLRSLPQ
ncbi:MAG: diaminopimelate epimerase [Gemmatimonadales bacterium]